MLHQSFTWVKVPVLPELVVQTWGGIHPYYQNILTWQLMVVFQHEQWPEVDDTLQLSVVCQQTQVPSSNFKFTDRKVWKPFIISVTQPHSWQETPSPTQRLYYFHFSFLNRAWSCTAQSMFFAILPSFIWDSFSGSACGFCVYTKWTDSWDTSNTFLTFSKLRFPVLPNQLEGEVSTDTSQVNIMKRYSPVNSCQIIW